jgi:hypothetical protein
MVSTRRAGSGHDAVAVPEPALRPVEARFPNRYAARRARIYVDRGESGTAIVIRDPRGRERRIPAGPGGVTHVVLEHASAPGLLLGGLALRAEGGQVLACLPRMSWQPESPGDESVYDAGQAADDAAAFAAATGLPVTDNRRARPPGHTGHDGKPVTHPGAAGSARRSGDKPAAVVSYRTALPPWFLAARALLAVGAAGLLIAMLVGASLGSGKGAHSFASGGTYQALALTCAALVLAQPLLAGVLFARAWWLDRASGRGLPESAAALAPHPAGPTTSRFLRTASLRLFPADLVATGEDGEERWLPRSGPTGVAELVRVTVRGRPSRLELRTADGRPRAVLPWDDWFAGAGGERALADFAAAAGLPVREAEGKHIPESQETIWQYRPLRFSSASAAAGYLRWRGLPGPTSLGLPIIFGIFSAIAAVASPVALVLALAAVIMTAGPWYARRLARGRLDRPVKPGEAA